MQAKDIPDKVMLEFFAEMNGSWAMLFGEKFSVWIGGECKEFQPFKAPYKVMLAKMRALHRRKLIAGCPCGCRGDFRITDKGRAWLMEHQQACKS